MLFNVTISPNAPGGIGISVQVEAVDLVAALDAAKKPILKSAQDSAATLLAAIPASNPAQPTAPVGPPL